MKKENLILIMELLSTVNLGPVTDPNFEVNAAKLINLKKEVEQELNGNNDGPNTSS